MSTVVVVESPAKAKTINRYLGKDYDVVASYGHVRDLPSKDGSVDPEQDFAMTWQVDGRGKKNVDAIAKLMKNAERLVLATDPDREGEAISWHILELLNNKKLLKDKKIERVAFNEITKSAIQEAFEHPREVDQQLVDAYLARRALDYLVGFTLSPVLWRKLPGSRSAGRVQSVALRLVCEREEEIEQFKPQEYWTIETLMANSAGTAFNGRLTRLENTKLKKFDIPTEPEAEKAATTVRGQSFKVQEIRKKTINRNPSPPFITSTLQQEAARKLGFGATRTMRTAQSLYEGTDLGGETVGLITYMRTDGVQLAQSALESIRRLIDKTYGDKYLPEQPRFFKSKAKKAQEAHEAIRPTDVSRHPKEMRRYLSDDEARLYELIWKRTVACQMSPAKIDQVSVDFMGEDQKTMLGATGSTIAFDGFIKVYMEGRDDPEDSEGDQEGGSASTFGEDNLLPPLKEGETIDLKDVTPEQHFTKPPPRFTEASLVKKLEELGIGRPSTYASILQVLQARDYVRLDQKRFFPEDRGRVVTAFLNRFFEKYVAYDFTADLEEQLDQISEGEMDWKQMLEQFWHDFKAAVDDTKDLRISEVLDALNDLLGPLYFPRDEDGNPNRSCPSCEIGTLSIKTGKMGAFIGCSRYPDCSYTRPLVTATGGEDGEETPTLPKDLGAHPDSGKMVTLRLGPYGLYVQEGEATEDEPKPRRAGLPGGTKADDVTLERAVELLRLPRDVGKHPETGEMIIANNGRFGPYLLHDGLFVSLPSEEDLFTVGINRAVDMIAEKEVKVDRKRLGEHPKTGTPIYRQKGRYGYFVQWGQKKTNIPKQMEPQEVTLEDALALFDKDKEAKKASKSGGKKAATKKSPAKKAAKKTAAQKKTTKKSKPKTKSTRSQKKA